MAAMLAWVGFAFWNRTITPEWGTFDLYEILFYVGVSMALICLVEAVSVGRKPSVEEPEEAEVSEAYASEYGAMMEKVERLRRLRPRRQ